ncbi:TPA: alpha/beta hydrolase [Klebsiella quasipneumoniae subsp. similipneumoniae]|nr:alpha/beta hydrolase [Klebsiella quasipneumoniae subsp. similipneumoniae]
MPEIFDHEGNPVQHRRVRVNGIRMHYVIAGSGEPLLLLHGTPKTHYYWHKLIPLLTKNFMVIAPDLRGFGDTDKPESSSGYDSMTNAYDMRDLMNSLDVSQYYVHGEDRGAEFAYVLSCLDKGKVKALSFCEMLLSGNLLEEMSYFTEKNIHRQFDKNGVWQWHIPFFWIPHIPEMLISGREREFWEYWMKQETWNPSALDDETLTEWVSHLKKPGGLYGVLSTYRANFVNAEINKKLAKEKLDIPVLTIGAKEFMGDLVEQEISKLVSGRSKSLVWDECGHSLALEKPDELAEELVNFFKI